MKTCFVTVLMVLGLLSACGNSAQWPPVPATIHLGEDSCAACRMIISQESYGVQLHQRGKQIELFDDYGCLLTRRPAGDSETVIYVRSAKDGSWIREGQASYVVSRQIPSPMGYGIAAFDTKESAAEFAAGLDGSEIYSVSEIISGTDKILRGR